MQHRLMVRSLLFLCGVMALMPVAARGQSGTVVSGFVRSTTGTPLVGAVVRVAALNVGATTNAEGRYSFTLPPTASGSVEISVRRIGYKATTATVTVAGAPITRDFTLTVSATELAEVVVTAMGQERARSTLGTAQQQLNAGELNETRAQNLIQQIQGKVSGVQITSPGTQGGSTNIIIRGQNSITGNNQPLFIVDGVSVSNANRGGAPFVGSNTTFDFGNALSDINPDDIESLSVLKGPNAAAIYGSRAEWCGSHHNA
jgi:outer membrane receptor protein involved in Fe transport